MSELPSYRKIDYTLRPAKNIERKMIAEACARLTPFTPIGDYRYIGFGSPFFSDFRLFHRTLGFNTMINIEAEESDADRFAFNKPFKNIDLKYGWSSERLPELAWRDLPTVIWMDYDRPLNVEMLDDIGYLTANLLGSSMMIITVEAKASVFGNGPEKLKTFHEIFGEPLSANIRQEHLAQSRIATTLYRMINDKIVDTLADRNAALTQPTRIEYSQIFNFIYDDGTPMITVGGILSQRSERDRFDSCGFNSLDFCRAGSEPYEIYAPLLTFKEQRHIDSQLPSSCAECPGVSEEDVEAYSRVYRYFPAFTEIEL